MSAYSPISRSSSTSAPGVIFRMSRMGRTARPSATESGRSISINRSRISELAAASWGWTTVLLVGRSTVRDRAAEGATANSKAGSGGHCGRQLCPGHCGNAHPNRKLLLLGRRRFITIRLDLIYLFPPQRGVEGLRLFGLGRRRGNGGLDAGKHLECTSELLAPFLEKPAQPVLQVAHYAASAFACGSIDRRCGCAVSALSSALSRRSASLTAREDSTTSSSP